MAGEVDHPKDDSDRAAQDRSDDDIAGEPHHDGIPLDLFWARLDRVDL